MPVNGEIDRVVGHRKNPKGPGEQYEVLWVGQDGSTWEAASRMRTQVPLLVRAFEELQQRPQQQPPPRQQQPDPMDTSDDGAEGARQSDAPPASSESTDLVRMRQQLEEQARLIQQMVNRQQPDYAPSSSPRGSLSREPRLADLANYDGASGARLDDWLAELDQIAQYNALDAQRTVAYGVVHLKGAARTWWSTLDIGARQAIISHASLATALRARFQPVTSATTARAELYALVQGNRGVDAFIADFQRLTAQLPSMAEDDRVFQFTRGVRRDIADKLRLDGVATVAQAITIAARIGNLTDGAPRVAAGSYGQQASRLHQMDAMDDVDSATAPQTATDARLHRLEQTMHQTLNQLQTFAAGNGGVGAKTQTKRGYQQANSSGRSGAPRPGRPFQPRMVPVIPGVSEDVVRSRWDNRQCLRCGQGDHRSLACPNPISSSN